MRRYKRKIRRKGKITFEESFCHLLTLKMLINASSVFSAYLLMNFQVFQIEKFLLQKKKFTEIKVTLFCAFSCHKKLAKYNFSRI
jgi:hypothetical protein